MCLNVIVQVISPLLSIVSKITGIFSKLPLPTVILENLGKLLKIDLSDSELKEYSKFRTLHDLFIRKLSANARTIQTSAVVSPVDGFLRRAEQINSGTIIQAKNRSFSVADLLLIDSKIETGLSLSLYLSPKDYHRVHMPKSGRLDKVTHIPGCLFPVNNPSLNNIFPLYLNNERVVCTFDSDTTPWYLVFIAALNVGGISVTATDEFTKIDKIYPSITPLKSPVALNAGDELGYFSLGSSVIVIIPGAVENDLSEIKSGPVKMGDKLI